MKKIETLAGTFTTDRYEMPGNYILPEKAKIEQIDAGHVRIITMDQKVEWKNQSFSPVVYQSCMKPDEITVYPLKIQRIGDKLIFQDHYHKGEWTASEGRIHISDWYPRLKKGGCFPCTNCGRW